jgi:type II secretory ATPase GspE/PulE/Tfp pilus assembly ATPase PilB-like protein
MSSSQGKLTYTEAIGQEVLNVTTAEAQWFGDRQQIFKLMDSLLSFEACLYHQILPLRLEDNQLFVGMVHPQDDEALNYVNRILSYVKSTMVIEAIAVDVHRTTLSAYLNYKNTVRSDAQKQDQPKIELINESVNAESEHNPPSVLLAEHPECSPPAEDQPEIELINKSVNAESEHNPPSVLLAEHPECSPPVVDSLSDTATFVIPFKNNQKITPTNTALLDDLTTLVAQLPDKLSPIEVLSTLPPKTLLQELLGRVFAGGIGRLYLERQPYQGRILWSDNGVLQSVIENLPLSVLQGVLNELKRFAGLPMTRTTEAKQVEKEYLYQKNRLLLRLRVMPGMYGEEATLQVLRGAALKFYQQQQFGHVSLEALNIAQQLNSKLYELQQRLVLNPNLQPEQFDTLIALNKLVVNLNQQIKTMTGNIQREDKIK